MSLWKPIIFLIVFSALIIVSTPLAAATYHLGAGIVTPPLNPILKIGAGSSTCAQTWYDPELYTLPGGNLQLLTQGGNAQQACPTPGIDAIFGATRINPSAHNVGGWSLPTITGCPQLAGGYSRCSYSPGSPGPLSSPSVVKVGTTYYMAFGGGNADYIAGKVYWAVSTNGTSWTVYNVNPPNGEQWTPLIYGKCGPDCVGSQSQPNGISTLQLAYENGYFYFFLQFNHYPTVTPAPPQYSSQAFRIAYSATDPFGLGSSRQIYYNNTWQNHSGHLVWNYDTCSPDAGDFALDAANGMHQYGFGGGDVKWDPARGNWLRIATWGDTHTQTATSLALSDWSATTTLDMNPLIGASGRYPNTAMYNPGLWWGTAPGSTTSKMWIYVPVSDLGCGMSFAGLGIVHGELEYY